MGKRNNAKVFGDLFKIAAMLPWWAGLPLAAAAYGVLHHYAVAELPIDVAPQQISQLIIPAALKGLAMYGQYMVPLPFVAGAAASFLGRRKRSGLVRAVATDCSGEAMRAMDWRDFERLVGEAFRMRGFAVTETGGVADGGIDLKLRRGGESFLVQCKQWRAAAVSVGVVRELYGVMSAEGATGGFVVTCGRFTRDAQSFAQGRNIELIDGSALTGMIETTRKASEVSPPSQPHSTQAGSAPKPSQVPSCPHCGSAMVKRTAAKGPHPGRTFWGCPSYPRCRGIRTIL